MQGADLSSADLADSEFDETVVFRTNITDAHLATAAVGSVYADADQLMINDDGERGPLTPQDIDGWIVAATKFASAGSEDAIVKRFDRLKLDFQDNPDEVKWSGMREASLALDPDGAQHRQRLARFLGDLACEAADAPYTGRRLLLEIAFGPRLAALGDQSTAFRARLEDGRKAPEKCPGVTGFTEKDWRALDAIKPD